MLRTLPQIKKHNWTLRIASVALFVIFMILSSRLSFETGNPEVPFTMQVFVVLLSGMVLGSVDGAAVQIVYLGLIASGQPFDVRGIGAAALFGPTGGFLIGFLPAAYIAGLMTERAGKRLWQRWLAGVVGIAIIYVFGAAHLMLYTGMDARRAYEVGVAPFIVLDLIKALIAAGMVETSRAVLTSRDG